MSPPKEQGKSPGSSPGWRGKALAACTLAILFKSAEIGDALIAHGFYAGRGEIPGDFTRISGGATGTHKVWGLAVKKRAS